MMGPASILDTVNNTETPTGSSPASNVGHEAEANKDTDKDTKEGDKDGDGGKEEVEGNRVGTLSKTEAKMALRKHKGNIWAAVTECVESRQAKVRKRFIGTRELCRLVVMP